MNFFKLYIGDYQRDTAHLSVTAHGAYMLMLQHYYATEKPLPVGKALHRMLRATEKAERDAIDAISAEFWTVTDAGLVNERADEEIKKAASQADANRRVAQAREKARKATRTAHDLSTNRATIDQPNHSHSQTKDISLLSQAPTRPPDEVQPIALVEQGRKPPPDCPHGDILALWAEVLPALPQHLPDQWRGARADHLRARWREAATAKGWREKAEGIAYFRKLFSYVGQSPFLTGKTTPGNGKRPFVVELEWLVNPSNWAKTHEGKYHQEQAA